MIRAALVALVGLLAALAAPAHADTGGSMGGGSWGSTSSGGGSFSTHDDDDHRGFGARPSGPSLLDEMRRDRERDAARRRERERDRERDEARRAAVRGMAEAPDDDTPMTPEEIAERDRRIAAWERETAESAAEFDRSTTRWFIGFGVLALAGFGVTSTLDRWRRPRRVTGGPSVELETVDVTALRIAVDGRARRFVQAALRRIAAGADTATPEGRAAMLREVTTLLRQVRGAWAYGGAVNQPLRTPTAAQQMFNALVLEARAAFRHEVVRNADGTTTTAAAPAATPRPAEGEGLILVTLVVAAHTELVTVGHIADGEDLRKALEAAGHRPASDLIAIEIIWQPADDADRLSSVELEARWPRPALLPIAGALVGKVFCDHCGGPYPAELVSCPHCGAPAISRAA